MFDFTSEYARFGTGSIKWDVIEENPSYEGAYPFSVADMEWGTAPAIREACSRFAERGFYCYTAGDAKYRKTVCDYMQRRHGWKISPEDIVTTYGIVSAIHTCVRAYTKPGEGVIVQQPVYAHFMGAIETNGRKVVNNPLVINNGRYEMNFEELEELCRDENNRLLILCSPHNPVGRVWDRDELERLAKICLANNITIVSDEIHFDITSKPHTVLAGISEDIARITVTCTAPSKSFNIAGLGTSNIIITDPALRDIFTLRLAKDGYECINCFAYPAITAAYTECDDWLDEMNRNVHENFIFMRDYIKENIPSIKTFELEGTYLAWLDVSAYNIPDAEVQRFFAENAGVVANYGGWFGKEGEGYIRLNIAVPRAVLASALERMKELDSKIKQGELK